MTRTGQSVRERLAVSAFPDSTGETASTRFAAQRAERALLDLLSVERRWNVTVQIMPREDGGCSFEAIHVSGKLLFSVEVARNGSVTCQEGGGL